MARDLLVGWLSDIDDDGFGQAVLGAHAIGIPEELQAPETQFEDGGAVAEATLDGLPESQPLAGERYGPGARNPLARRLAVAKVVGQSPVKNHDDDVAGLVKIPDKANVGLVEHEAAPTELEGRPKHDCDEEVDHVAEKPLPEGGERQAMQFLKTGGMVRVESAPGFLELWSHGCSVTEGLIGG